MSEQPPQRFVGEPVLEVFCRPAALLPSTTMPASADDVADSGAVIVALSANQQCGTTAQEETNRDIENVAFLRAVARSLS